MISWKSWIVPFSVGLTLIITSPALAAGRYFPDTGRAAIHQRTLDLRGSTVVMYVALEPGHEDLPLLSRFRFGDGARTVVVYVTNGDATPNDLNGDPPQYTAARRKEEAFAAASLVGAQVYFLNLPDPGAVASSEVLERIWGRDSTTLRFQRALRSHRPDLLVIGGDLRGSTPASVRQGVISKLVRNAAEGNGSPAGELAIGTPWKVPRIVEEDMRGQWKSSPSVDGIHPVWKKSYRAFGAEAGRCYQSLRFSPGLWDGKRERAYNQVAGPRISRRGSMLEGLPQVSKRLLGLRASIRKTAAVGTPVLERVSATIDSVEFVIARRGNDLNPGELRLISGWKNSLEDLRCSLLGVTVVIEPTDSIVTQTQLMDLKVASVRSRASSGNLRIIFVGARDKKWGINESAESKFTLSPPEEFRVLTPHSEDYNAPVSQFGMLRPVPRTRFPFLIFHEDSIRARNFVYRGELALQVAPMRTFEVLTPAIRAQEGEPVVYRLMNVSRDKFRGTIGFADSLALPGEKSAVLEERYQVIIDTLRFVPTRDTLPGTFSVKVQISGEGISTRVLARRFDALTDPSARVGLVTPFADGVAERALHRLRIPFATLPTSGSPAGSPAGSAAGSPARSLEGLNAVVLDREALGRLSDVKAWDSALERWMAGGGHLILLPQQTLAGDLSFLHGLRFGPANPTEPMEQISTSNDHPFLRTPNLIEEDDWRVWVVSRSVGGIALPGNADEEGVVRPAGGGAPYLATKRVGNGRLTLVSLDLISQLTNIHPGAHRLLANLLRPAH